MRRDCITETAYLVANQGEPYFLVVEIKEVVKFDAEYCPEAHVNETCYEGTESN